MAVKLTKEQRLWQRARILQDQMENLIGETEIDGAIYSPTDKILYVDLSQKMPLDAFCLYMSRTCEILGLNPTTKIVHRMTGNSYSINMRDMHQGDHALFQISPIRIKFNDKKDSKDLIHLIGDSISRVVPTFDVTGLIMGSSRNYELIFQEGNERFAYALETLID